MSNPALQTGLSSDSVCFKKGKQDLLTFLNDLTIKDSDSPETFASAVGSRIRHLLSNYDLTSNEVDDLASDFYWNILFTDQEKIADYVMAVVEEADRWNFNEDKIHRWLQGVYSACIERNNPVLLQRLTESWIEPDFYYKNNTGQTLLQAAIMAKTLPCVRLLLKTHPFPSEYVKSLGDGFDSPIGYALYFNCPDIAEFLHLLGAPLPANAESMPKTLEEDAPQSIDWLLYHGIASLNDSDEIAFGEGKADLLAARRAKVLESNPWNHPLYLILITEGFLNARIALKVSQALCNLLQENACQGDDPNRFAQPIKTLYKAIKAFYPANYRHWISWISTNCTTWIGLDDEVFDAFQKNTSDWLSTIDSYTDYT